MFDDFDLYPQIEEYYNDLEEWETRENMEVEEYEEPDA